MLYISNFMLFVMRYDCQKGFNQQSCYLQCYLRARAMVQFDRPHTIFHCNYVSCLALITRYYHLFPKIERGHMTLNTSTLRIICYKCTSTPVYQSAHEI